MDIEFAIENANLAWKNAKNTGKRDITLYNPSLRIQRTEEQKIVGEFYEALYRDDFQMYLHIGKSFISVVQTIDHFFLTFICNQ